MKKVSLYCSTVFKGQVSKDDSLSLSHDIINRLNQEIGSPKDMTNSYKRELKAIDTEIKLLKNNIKPNSETKKRIKLKQKQSTIHKKRLSSEKLRLKRHQKIYTDLGKHIANTLINTNFMLTTKEILESLNLMSGKYMTLPLLNMNQLNIHNIKSYGLMIDRFVKVKPNKKMTWWNEYHQDIFRMVATQEQTGIGIKLLDTILGLKDTIYEQQQPLVEEYNEINSYFMRRVRTQLVNNKDRDGGISKSYVFRQENKMVMDYPIVKNVDGSESVAPEEIIEKTWDMLSNSEKMEVIESDYVNLKADLADGRVRHIEPVLYQNLTSKEVTFLNGYKNNYTNEFGEPYKGPSHHEMIIKQKDGRESVWVMMKRNEDQSEPGRQHEYWAAVLIRRGGKDPTTGDFMWDGTIGAQLPDIWENTGMQAGFHEAGKHQIYDYTIANSDTNVGSYSDFKYLEKQPHKSITGISNTIDNPGQYNIWQAISLTRDLNSKIMKILQEGALTGNKNYLETVRLAKIKFKKDGMLDAETFIEKIEELGQMTANILPTEDGTMIGWDTFIKKVTHSFDPRIYHKDNYWADSDAAIKGTQRDLDSWEEEKAKSEQIINQYLEGVSTGEQLITDDEFTLHMNTVSKYNVKIKKYTKIIDAMSEMRSLAQEEASPENIKKMTLAHYTVHGKQRKTFANPMNRRRDLEVGRDYITRVITAIQYKHLKNELLKGMMIIESNDMKEWFLNQTKVAIQDYTYEAGFMGIDWSFQKYANAKNKVYKAFGSTRKFSAAEIAKSATNHNNWVSGMVLNSLSSLTNLTQLESTVEDWGLEDTLGIGDELKRDDIQEALKLTGVKDLISAYSDFMAGGSQDDIGWTTPVTARFNWALLKLNKSTFINKNTGIDKWLQRMLPDKDKDNFNALRRQRANFYEQMTYLGKLLTKHGNVGTEGKENSIKKINASRKEIEVLKSRIRSLNSSLNSSQINQLASWMLTWIKPDKASPLLTFSGAELMMRERTAVQGMLLSEKLDMLDADKGGNIYKQAPAQWMARLNTYNTMFGMSREYFPKMFGGMGVVGLQFKTYTFAQWVREYNTMERFFDSHKGGVFNVPGWLPRLLKTLAKKGARAYSGKKLGYTELLLSGDPDFDLSAERFANFLGIRGLLSMVITAMTYTPILSEVFNAVRSFDRSSPFGFLNATRGGQSVILSRILKTFLLIYAGMAGMDDEDEERLYQDWHMFFLPVFVNAMIRASKGDIKGASRTYIPGSKPALNAWEILGGEGR